MAFKAATIGLLALGAAVNAQSCDDVYQGYQCQPEISHLWGQYSPYFTVPSDIKDTVPAQCTVSFVQHLERHGARFPTSKKTTTYKAMMTQVINGAAPFTGKYAFLNNFQYTLGSDVLTGFGSQQLVNSGIKFYGRYKSLADKYTPFVRSSGSQRVVDSATNWTSGFHSAKSAGCSSCANPYPYNIVVISEDAGSNNTLDSSTCPYFASGPDSSIGSSAQSAFANQFVGPIQARLNADMPGASLTAAQVIYFMDMCPFETVADANGKISDFCGLFTQSEWASYNYYQSLGKWYGQGDGNPLGATQGVGFVNELIARLTSNPVKDHTNTNSTLDSNPATFPLGSGYPLYADFSHDDPMTSIFSAMGLYDRTPQLSNSTIMPTDKTYGYSAAWTVPFGGRAYIEKQSCKTVCAGQWTTTEYVRVIINDRVVPMPNCGSDSLGRCKLNDFVNSMSFATSGGFWSSC